MWGSVKGNHVVVTSVDSCTSASMSTGAWGKQIQNLTTRVLANFSGILHKCHLESVNLAMKQLETFNLGFHVLTRNLNSICIIITDNCSEICWRWYNSIYKGNFELHFHIVNFESNQNATPKSLEVTQTKNVLFLSLKSGPLSKPLSKMEKVDKFFDTQYPWAFVVRKEQKGL